MFGRRHCLPWLVFCSATIAARLALTTGLSRDWASLLVYGGCVVAMVSL